MLSPLLALAENGVAEIQPSAEQKITLWVALGYIAFIAIVWNIPYLRGILAPFKLLTVALHESSHACAAWGTCGHVDSIDINAMEGGSTATRGGVQSCILPGGYIGSAIWGGILVFCAFNILASQIAAGVVGGLLIIVSLFFAKENKALIRGLTFFIVVMEVLFYVFLPQGLRFFVLFMGVMSSLYALWDMFDDLIRRRVAESDVSKFQKMYPCCPAQGWGLIWAVFSLVILAGFLILALLVFKDPDTRP